MYLINGYRRLNVLEIILYSKVVSSDCQIFNSTKYFDSL